VNNRNCRLALIDQKRYDMQQFIEAGIKIFSFSTLRYFILAGLPFVLFYYLLPERFKKFKIQQKVASRKDFVREIWHSMQSTLVFSLVAAVIFLTPLKQHTLIYDHLSDYPIWYIFASLLLSLIIHDTYFYWMHRVLHHKSIFKIAHVVHHKSTNPSPWTSYSFHIFEAVFEGLVLFIVVFTIPMHPLTILLFTVVGFIINVYGHLGYEIMPKGFRKTIAFEILNSSIHHNLHHSKFKGNYGLHLRFWDRIMGTEHPDYVKEYDRVQVQRFGKKEL
jgi:lathosterol oxidase